MPRSSKRNSQKSNQRPKQPVGETTLRIIGGHFRGRKLRYAGDTRVRPMKDRVREALFNLLGPAIKGTFAIDLFGGTGALGLEAISRGSLGAVIVERHLPTAKVIRENIETLDLQERIELVNADTFRWYQQQPSFPDMPWVVFVSPPYSFFTERHEEMLELIESFLKIAPSGTKIAVEATRDFDFSTLPQADSWDVREYSPAVVGVLTIAETID